MAGLGSGTASADVLDDIGAQYDTGAGGGQVSELIHVALKMRALASSRPRATWTISSPRWTTPQPGAVDRRADEHDCFQKRNQARGQQQQKPVTIGINQYDPTNPSVPLVDSVSAPPGGGINIPLGP